MIKAGAKKCFKEAKMFNLLEQLKGYKPYDEKEQEDVLRVVTFLENNKNCYDRSNLIGHVTAGAFVCDHQGNILLNHHKKSGMWFQFGGHCDFEEDCLAVAKREVQEEAGITDFKLGKTSIFDVAVVNVPKSTKKNEPEHVHYDINFLFFVDSRDYMVSSESIEAKWVTTGEALSLVDKNDYGIIRMINKYKEFLTENKIM